MEFKFFLGQSDPFAASVLRQVNRRFDSSPSNFKKCFIVSAGEISGQPDLFLPGLGVLGYECPNPPEHWFYRLKSRHMSLNLTESS